MFRSINPRSLNLFLGLFLAGLSGVSACRSSFTSCEESRTCVPAVGGGGGESVGATTGGYGGGQGEGGDGGADCGGVACTCEVGEIVCEDECIHPQSDRSYCGASGDCTGESAGEICEESDECVQGACTLVCDAPFINCDDTCINPLGDANFCGAVGTCAEADRGDTCVQDEACLGGKCRSWGAATLSGTRGDNHINFFSFAMAPTGDASIAYFSPAWSIRTYSQSSGLWKSPQELTTATSTTRSLGMTDKGIGLMLMAQHDGTVWKMASSIGPGGNFPPLAAMTPQTTTRAPTYSSLATGPDGAALGAWRLDVDPGIVVSIFDAESTTWNGATVISSNQAAAWPQLATNNNRHLVVWTEVPSPYHLVAGLNSTGSWSVANVPGSTTNGAIQRKTLLRETGEALVVYETTLGDLETWGVPYSFVEGAWGEHFLIRSGAAKVIESGEGALAYGLVESEIATEIWWRPTSEGLADFGTAKSQVLLNEPAEELVLVSNEAGQVLGLIATGIEIYWTMLDTETATWSPPASFERQVGDDLTLKDVHAGMDRFGRVIVAWREPAAGLNSWDGVWTRRLE